MGLGGRHLILFTIIAVCLLTSFFYIGYGFGYKQAIINSYQQEKPEQECLVWVEEENEQVLFSDAVYESYVEEIK